MYLGTKPGRSVSHHNPSGSHFFLSGSVICTIGYSELKNSGSKPPLSSPASASIFQLTEVIDQFDPRFMAVRVERHLTLRLPHEIWLFSAMVPHKHVCIPLVRRRASPSGFRTSHIPTTAGPQPSGSGFSRSTVFQTDFFADLGPIPKHRYHD